MEDRYLFKAKRIDNGEWVTGHYVKGLNMYDKEVHLIFEPNTMFYSSGETDGWYKVDPTTICQCTGFVVCSKTFTPTAANQNTCCEAHREQRATELRKIREKKRLKRKPVKKNKLAEICKIAKSKGMSYGQYMAEQYKKEVMIR